MKALIMIFLGGGLGSILRFGLGKWVNSLHNHHFPFGTLVVNVVACFALGILIGLADHKQMLSPAAKTFWIIGFCGGFSTFSTFSGETIYLLQSGFTTSMILYIGLSLVLCVGATMVGLYVGQTA